MTDQPDRPLTVAERDELDRLLADVCLPTFTDREREIARLAARTVLRRAQTAPPADRPTCEQSVYHPPSAPQRAAPAVW